MSTTLIVYLLCSYLAMYIAATFMIGTTHKPGISTKLVGAATFLLAPITFLLLMGWFLLCIVYNLITD